MSLTQISQSKCFDGWQFRFSHRSITCNCTMYFSIYLPLSAKDTPVPVLYWLSGLTCTDENFVQKAGAQRFAATHGIAIVCPDTSPRGEDVPIDEDEAYDFGRGAGFYLDATQSPFAMNYHMSDYVTSELPILIEDAFPVSDARAISGHSMGGHGALTIALKNPGRYKSVSAFAPIVAPTQVPWGQRAFRGYLGPDQNSWQDYDACALIPGAEERLPLLIDQGTADEFLNEQLKPHLLEEACAAADHPLTLHMRDGFDHSYLFIASFIGAHIEHHAKALKG